MSERQFTYGSLFSGIGGIDLGLDRAGWQCKWQIEQDDYARAILEKHWPAVPKWNDAKTFPPDEGDWDCDLIAGGFPCQPVSNAGKALGVKDARWLWPEFIRIIRVLRPRFVLVENVPGMLIHGMEYVIRDLAKARYDAEWSCVSACSMGAAHPRARLFIVAYPAGFMGEEGLRIRELAETRTIQRCDDLTAPVLRMESTHRNSGNFDGISKRLDQGMRALGNAVVPQVAEFIGRRLLDAIRGH